jgi:hypothetical protein
VNVTSFEVFVPPRVLVEGTADGVHRANGRVGDG